MKDLELKGRGPLLSCCAMALMVSWLGCPLFPKYQVAAGLQPRHAPEKQLCILQMQHWRTSQSTSCGCWGGHCCLSQWLHCPTCQPSTTAIFCFSLRFPHQDAWFGGRWLNTGSEAGFSCDFIAAGGACAVNTDEAVHRGLVFRHCCWWWSLWWNAQSGNCCETAAVRDQD